MIYEAIREELRLNVILQSHRDLEYHTYLMWMQSMLLRIFGLSDEERR